LPCAQSCACQIAMVSASCGFAHWHWCRQYESLLPMGRPESGQASSLALRACALTVPDARSLRYCSSTSLALPLCVPHTACRSPPAIKHQAIVRAGSSGGAIA
jgi:hypothetical protein